MREGLLIGAPGAGKTAVLDALRRWSQAGRGHPIRHRRGQRAATSLLPVHRLREHRPEEGNTPSSELVLPVGGYRHLRIWEVPGLAEAPLPEQPLRRQQSRALALLVGSALILHVVDANRVGEIGVEGLTDTDRHLAAVGLRRGPGYALLAAKLDRPWAHRGVRLLEEWFRPPVLLPVSAHTGLGVRGILTFLRHPR